MSDVVQTVVTQEPLSRFVLRKDWVRSIDQSLRPDAFIPHPHDDLSVTRLNGRSEENIWQGGLAVSSLRNLPLHGRADFSSATVIEQSLRVDPDPLPEDNHHAVIRNWPPTKALQKIKALEIASKAKFVPCVTEA